MNVEGMDDRDLFIGEAVERLVRAFPDLEVQKARNALFLAASGWRFEKTGTEIVLYEDSRSERAFQAFIVAKKVAGRTEATLGFYLKTLRAVFRRIGKDPQSATTNDIRVYLAEREIKDKASDVTRNNERRVLSSFYKWLEDEEMISKNPMRKIVEIKVRKKKRRAFTDMDVEKLRDAARNEKEAAVVEVLLSTGCRVSELCGMKVSEIDLDEGAVTVHGKGNKDRMCYLNARSVLAIRKWLGTEQYRTRKAKGSEWLFPRRRMDGENAAMPMDKGSVESMVRGIGDRAGVENVHPHRFRRTCATHALESGMPIQLVSKMLGHEDISTTQVYLDLEGDALQQAHKKFVK